TTHGIPQSVPMCSAGVVFGHERVSGDGRLFRVEQVVEFGDQPDEAAEDEDRGGGTDDTHQEYVEAHRGYPAIWQRPTIQKNRNGSSFSPYRHRAAVTPSSRRSSSRCITSRPW